LYFTQIQVRYFSRKGITKFGEEWTFFGGKIEEGETALEAAIREIDEELGYILDNPIHIGSCSTITTLIKTNEKVEMSAEVYSKKMDEDLSIFELKEGSGLKFFRIEEAKQLKLGPLDHKIIAMFEKSLVV